MKRQRTMALVSTGKYAGHPRHDAVFVAKSRTVIAELMFAQIPRQSHSCYQPNGVVSNIFLQCAGRPAKKGIW